MKSQQSSRVKTAAPGEVIYTQGFVGNASLYIINSGKIEISTYHDDKKVVLATLGKGQFFGESAVFPSEPRWSTAKAVTFCELTEVDAGSVERHLGDASPLVQHMLRTLLLRLKARDEAIAAYTRADFLPGIVSYAHVLSMMAQGASDSGFGRLRRNEQAEAVLPLSDVLAKCRAIAGHSRVQVLATLKRMSMLNLVSLDGAQPPSRGGRVNLRQEVPSEEAAGRLTVRFDSTRIIDHAEQVAGEEMDVSIKAELELIELVDLESLIGIERQLLLKKLAYAEIAEEIFAFRKTEVLNYIESKGHEYFTKRRKRAANEIESLDDLDLVDERILFDAVNAMDTYDLAKLLQGISNEAFGGRISDALARAKRDEVSWIMRRDIRIDPAEIQQIEDELVESIRSMIRPHSV